MASEMLPMLVDMHDTAVAAEFMELAMLLVAAFCSSMALVEPTM
jgi:hypothetical protein